MRKRASSIHARLVTIASACLVYAGTASGQIVGEGRPVGGQINEHVLITLDVEERPLEDVLDHIRDRVGISLITPPGTEGLVTVQLRNHPWREALDLVAESASCVVEEVGTNVYRIEKPPRVTMAFPGVDIKVVIEAIAKAGNANIIVSERVTGLVTMVINDQPWRDALEAVVKTNGYFVVEENRGILRVVDQDGLSTHRERRMFQLRYLRPKDEFAAKIDTLYASGEVKPAEGDMTKDFPLLAAIQNMVSEQGRSEYLPAQNAIMVTDTRNVLDDIEKFIERLDIEPMQVYIDVKFVSTSKVNTQEVALGFDQGMTAQLTGAARTSNLPFNLGPGSLLDNLLPGPRNDPNDPLLPFSPVSPGVLDFSSTSLAVRLLKEDATAEIVQRPSLITLNDHAATIFVGETIRYAQAEASSNQSGGLQLTVTEAPNSPVQTGFQLMVIPHVVPGTNKIKMTVMPEAESLTGTSDPNLPGFDRFEVGAGTTGEGVLSLPRIGSQTVVTHMMLENGQTGIVGGLLQRDTLLAETKVPVLGDIPWLGALFRDRVQRDDRRGLMVFVTPWIVRSVEGQNDTIEQTIEVLESELVDDWDAMIMDLGGPGAE